MGRPGFGLQSPTLFRPVSLLYDPHVSPTERQFDSLGLPVVIHQRLPEYTSPLAAVDSLWKYQGDP
jgi:hypothetical protein